MKNLLKIILLFIFLLGNNQVFAQSNTSATQTICGGSLAEPYLLNPSNSNSTYQWSLSGGGALNGTTTDSITVDWGLVAGTYILTLVETDVNGCTGAPVTVDVTLIVATTSTTAYTACDTYLWNGTTYTSSGTYTYSTTNSLGCDSTATLNLTINNATTSTTTSTACDTYLWNGTTYTSSGTYTYSTTNSLGCDSTATLSLTINQALSPPLAISSTACSGSAVPDLTATGLNLNWYSDIALTSLVATGSSFSTAQTAVGIYVYYVTQTGANTCESTATTVNLQIYALPVTGPISHW